MKYNSLPDFLSSDHCTALPLLPAALISSSLKLRGTCFHELWGCAHFCRGVLGSPVCDSPVLRSVTIPLAAGRSADRSGTRPSYAQCPVPSPSTALRQRTHNHAFLCWRPQAPRYGMFWKRCLQIIPVVVR